MFSDEFRHLEHIHRILAKHRLEGRVIVDVPLVFRILEILALDVGPELLRHFRTGHRPSTYHDREFWADLHRLHERGVTRRHNFLL